MVKVNRNYPYILATTLSVYVVGYKCVRFFHLATVCLLLFQLLSISIYTTGTHLCESHVNCA